MPRRTRNPRSRRTFQELSFWEKVKSVDRFFEGRDDVHQTLRRLVKRLERLGIPYAIVGGMAVNAHGHRRTTNDVDVLLTREGFEEFRKHFVPKNYKVADPKRQRRLTDRSNDVAVDVLLTGLFPGSGKPGPVAFPDPAQASEFVRKTRVVNLPTLIQLKLAARRWRDFADVVDLISVHNLDKSYLERLHPSVRKDFIECLEEKRREDEYLARED